MKVCSRCGEEIPTHDGQNVCPKGCKRPAKGQRLTRKERDAIMASLGMVRVRGAMEGTYYE